MHFITLISLILPPASDRIMGHSYHLHLGHWVSIMELSLRIADPQIFYSLPLASCPIKPLLSKQPLRLIPLAISVMENVTKLAHSYVVYLVKHQSTGSNPSGRESPKG